MTDLLIAATLGLVEGLTEFLPVSSTGHLIITGYLLDYTGPKAESFQVAIQLGAILAVVCLYKERFKDLFNFRCERRFSGIRGWLLLALTSAPASFLGLLAHSYIKEHLFGPVTVAWALAIGAVYILLVERRGEGTSYESLDDVTPKLALGIGLFQCLALWPGFSRSAATIMGALLLGSRRKLAAEYSFVAAVPIMFAATGYDLYKSASLFSVADLPFWAVGFGVSFLSAWLAVKTFIHLVGCMTFRPFAWYRLALAPLVLLFWA
ncbi:undecaprenyl-diphosphate phosphatase [Oleidesulfovibrio sp.]|uniref:undecaprenyl-diphosphate phosphatase n=1 Tax=Oleidesulfovibrio sp. TaxID=2909707 RepID=UPI003A86519C